MTESCSLNVAVLMATYNGAQFVECQIRSFKNNVTPFTLHWLDDQSTDDTRSMVRDTAQSVGVDLREWHQQQHQGVPAAFFQLLECVEADIYLFSDQDDIWQEGKIDATVSNLLPHLNSPVLYSSDPYLFRDGAPDKLHRLSKVVGTDLKRALEESRLFMSTIAQGHTQGFTRPLRDLFMKHREIARAYAVMHDIWMHVIAVAAGTICRPTGVPTTLYRWHGDNASQTFVSWRGRGAGYLASSRFQLARTRRSLSRLAEGFILAAPTLPKTEKVERLIELARLVVTLDRRQSLGSLYRLMRSGVLWPSRRLALELVTSCFLFSYSHRLPDTSAS